MCYRGATGAARAPKPGKAPTKAACRRRRGLTRYGAAVLNDETRMLNFGIHICQQTFPSLLVFCFNLIPTF